LTFLLVFDFTSCAIAASSGEVQVVTNRFFFAAYAAPTP